MMRRNEKTLAITRCRLFCNIRRPSENFFDWQQNTARRTRQSGARVKLGRAPNTTHMIPKRSIKSLEIISIHQSRFYLKRKHKSIWLRFKFFFMCPASVWFINGLKFFFFVAVSTAYMSRIHEVDISFSSDPKTRRNRRPKQDLGTDLEWVSADTA